MIIQYHTCPPDMQELDRCRALARVSRKPKNSLPKSFLCLRSLKSCCTSGGRQSGAAVAGRSQIENACGFTQTFHTHTNTNTHTRTITDSYMFHGRFVAEFWFQFKSWNNCEVTSGLTQTACEMASAKRHFQSSGNSLGAWRMENNSVRFLLTLQHGLQMCSMTWAQYKSNGCNCVCWFAIAMTLMAFSEARCSAEFSITSFWFFHTYTVHTPIHFPWDSFAIVLRNWKPMSIALRFVCWKLAHMQNWHFDTGVLCR